MYSGMTKGRLEAFSDGVIAIIITIMVLEMKVPHGHDNANLETLRPVIPVFLSYVLSFLYLGIYWNNHHHMLHTVKHVNGRILWANLHLLFWLSLIPFVTAWMGENNFAFWPVIIYGVILLMAAFAYFILTNVIIVSHGKTSLLAKAIGDDVKGKVSLLIYLLALGMAWLHPLLSCLLYIVVAIIWFVPDKRIEKIMNHEDIV